MRGLLGTGMGWRGQIAARQKGSGADGYEAIRAAITF
jgi:hypothetical protein